ncbi:MAG: TPM domain-containing protein [Microcella sp.]
MTQRQATTRDARSRYARALTVGALAAGLLLASATPAVAAPPTDLDGAYVLDQVGVLEGDEQRVQDAIDRLFDAGGSLFVIVVERFDDALDSTDWVDQSASLSGLGDRDALLAIAVDDRLYDSSVGLEFPATDAQLAEAEQALVAELRDDRWADGIIAYADALTAALTAVEEPVDTPEEPGTDDPGTTPPAGEEAADEGGGIPIVPIALGAGGIGIAWYLIARARRKKGPVTAAVDRQSIAELDQTASRRLVQVDDALTTSEQELGFAEAQFGAAPTEGFRTALTRAKELVAEGFRLRRELDDENPETDEQKRATLLAIITACDEADDLLEAQEEAFEALRDVESDLPAAIAEVTKGREAAPAAIETAASTVERLRGEFAASALASVTDAPAQARRLLALIDTELAEAAQKQTAGSTSEAAIDVRSAQLALAQLTAATASVQSLADNLAAARTALVAQQDDLRSGIAAAAGLDAGAAGAALASAVTAAEKALAAAPADDPIAALERIVVADRALDTALAGAREEAERRAKAEAALERTLASASARIQTAADFIAANRGTIGAAARSRLAEAQAQESLALQQQASDPAAALQAAQRAVDYAGQAMQAAEGDRQAALAPSGPIGGLGGSGGSGVGDAIIGGLIGGLLSGGGGRSGGGFSGGFGGGFSGGGSRPRFGGSGGRPSGGARRSSAPRSSGRRGGGGRF